MGSCSKGAVTQDVVVICLTITTLKYAAIEMLLHEMAVRIVVVTLFIIHKLTCVAVMAH